MIVVVVVAYIFLKLYMDYSKSTTGGHVPTNSAAIHPPTPRQKIEQLMRTDPNFDLVKLLDHFRSAFVKIQQAWSAQDLTDVKHFLSDRVVERFSLQLQEQQDLGYRNVVDQVRISECTVADVDTSSMFDVVTVCVTAGAVDYRVSLSDGRPVSGNTKTPQSFTEYWTLIRRHGTKTVASTKSLLEGHCPNCGAEIELNRMGNCDSCDSVIRSGEYDWVVSEITQAGVWKPPSREQLELAEGFRNSADPGFSIHHVADRASVIFWRKSMADRLGEIAPLAKVASDEYCAAYADKFEMKSLGRTYLGNCSVGALSMTGVVRDEDVDHALIHVHYSAHVFRKDHDGKVTDMKNWKRYRSMMVLRRNKGVTSNVGLSLNSANCPSCGAPETSLVSHSCEFCGEVVNQGRYDWVMEQFHSWNSPEAREWQERLDEKADVIEAMAVDVPDSQSVVVDAELTSLDELAWTVKVLAADGKIHEQEKRQLAELAQRNSIPPQLAESLLSEPLADLDAPDPPDHATARRWLGDMTDMALVDGEISLEEKRLLTEVGRSSGLLAADINLIIAKRRAQARKRLRQQPSTYA